MLKRDIESIFLFICNLDNKRNPNIGIINKIVSVLTRKLNPKDTEEYIRNLYFCKRWYFLKNRYPSSTKRTVGTTFSEVLEYAQIIVEKASTNESIIEVCRVNLYSKQIRKKIPTENAKKNGA